MTAERARPGQDGRVRSPVGPPPLTTAPPWLDELELAPGPPTHHMGIRRLDPADWLLVDDQRDAELAHKADLLAATPNSVLGWLDEVDGHPVTDDAAELLDAVTDELKTRHGVSAVLDPDRHPLDAAGRLVQEDLTLLRTRADGVTVLTGGSVCFPSGWFLQEKLGRPLADVHEPIPEYQTELASRVDNYFARITPERPGWRRNWFVYDNPALFQPADPVHDPADDARRSFVIRSERQTMRRLPQTGALVFTIRTQQCELAALRDRPDIAEQMAHYFRAATPAVRITKGVQFYLADVLTELDTIIDGEPD